jgi:DNA-binding GntR family transcriptional regulator
MRLRPNVPFAVQVANQLRGQLRREYAEGGRLPSETALAAKMRVSRGTMRQALAILQHEGRISRRQGLGTFANPRVLGITS